ncbi:hypothetical protein CPB83DRAFT_900727 [Crepidotus variabilis]|uniref:C2H2-type domain-containing protein n=1 Tax=Crepidotus variabilis TaxID=179855 RepID=A0A9P6E2N5_9AGAR|nr:hypothetical protein CPB83DRAFT_900727 [Crepidotus variabilis]
MDLSFFLDGELVGTAHRSNVIGDLMCWFEDCCIAEYSGAKLAQHIAKVHMNHSARLTIKKAELEEEEEEDDVEMIWKGTLDNTEGKAAQEHPSTDSEPAGGLHALDLINNADSIAPVNAQEKSGVVHGACPAMPGVLRPADDDSMDVDIAAAEPSLQDCPLSPFQTSNSQVHSVSAQPMTASIPGPAPSTDDTVTLGPAPPAIEIREQLLVVDSDAGLDLGHQHSRAGVSSVQELLPSAPSDNPLTEQEVQGELDLFAAYHIANKTKRKKASDTICEICGHCGSNPAIKIHRGFYHDLQYNYVLDSGLVQTLYRYDPRFHLWCPQERCEYKQRSAKSMVAHMKSQHSIIWTQVKDGLSIDAPESEDDTGSVTPTAVGNRASRARRRAHPYEHPVPSGPSRSSPHAAAIPHTLARQPSFQPSGPLSPLNEVEPRSSNPILDTDTSVLNGMDVDPGVASSVQLPDPVEDLLAHLSIIVLDLDTFGRDPVPRMLVCTQCHAGVSPNPQGLVNHIRSKKHTIRHRLTSTNAELIFQWIQNDGKRPPANQLLAKSTCPINRRKRNFPIPFIAAPSDGFRCSFNGKCGFVFGAKQSLMNHYSQDHPGSNAVYDKILVQTLFKHHPKYFRVEPRIQDLTDEDRYTMYTREFASTLDSETYNPPISPNEEPLFHKEMRWSQCLQKYMEGGKEEVENLLALARLPTERRGKRWLGKPLERVVHSYMFQTQQMTVDLPPRVRRLLMEYPVLGNARRWTPILAQSIKKYACFLRRWIHAMFMTLDPDTLCDFRFPLTEDDIIRANLLKEILQEPVESDSELEAAVEALHNFIKPLLYPKIMTTPLPIHANANSRSEEGKSLLDVGSHQTVQRRSGKGKATALDDEGADKDDEGTDGDENSDAEERDKGGDDDSEDELDDYEVEEEDNNTQILTDKWDQPFEWFLALHSLRADGTFRAAKEVTTMFAMVHHHIRDAMVYSGVQAFKLGSVSNIAIENEVKLNLHPTVDSPYNAVADYQLFATTLVYNGGAPPTTRVSKDGMHISYREVSLSIENWRGGIKRLGEELTVELDQLLYHKDFGLKIPDDVSDDWSSTKRGDSWTKNAKFLDDDRCLFKEMLNDPNLQLASVDKCGKLQLHKAPMQDALKRFEAFATRLSFYAFITAGQTPRITEFSEHKFANSTRPRTNFLDNDGSGEGAEDEDGFFKPKALWLSIRRLKTENTTGKQTFLPAKCPPLLTNLLMRYLLIVRPTEKCLALHVHGRVSQGIYSEYLWVRDGVRIPETKLYTEFADLMKSYFGVQMGVQYYRQIVVEIGRVFLGSAARVEEDGFDAVTSQAGHGNRVARAHYAIEFTSLPGMSSDLLRQYGDASERWWTVTGCHPRKPPALPLRAQKHSLLADDLEKQRLFFLQEIPRMMTTALEAVWVIWFAAIVDFFKGFSPTN